MRIHGISSLRSFPGRAGRTASVQCRAVALGLSSAGVASCGRRKEATFLLKH
jgi:hypothetical protein